LEGSGLSVHTFSAGKFRNDEGHKPPALI